MSLTEADKQTLGKLASGDLHPKEVPDRPTVDYDGDEPPRMPHRIDDGRINVTLEQCNAIRCAAHDGKNYVEIADLFTFVGGRNTAHRHATGKCAHGIGDVPPVELQSEGNPNVVSMATCAQWRRGLDRGRWNDLAQLTRHVEWAKPTVHRHVRGYCEHGGLADD